MKSIKCLSGNQLKMIAVISMLIDHTAVVFIENRILRGSSPYQSGTTEAMAYFAGWRQIDMVMRGIGRLAFPIFCYLMVEGFLHTRDVRRYGARLLAFALLSEIPFDLAVFDRWFYPNYQNVYVTLFLGLLALIGLKKFQGEGSMWKQALTVAVCCCGAALLKSDYGAFGVFFVVLLYLLYGQVRQQTILGAIALAWEVTAPLAMIPIRMYDGTRGKRNLKWFFYIFYPAHLLILYLLCGQMMGRS